LNDHKSERDPGHKIEYDYIVRVKAVDLLVEVMKQEDVVIPQGFNLLSFKSPKLLNMRRYQETGLISSYIIIRTQKKEQVVEEGIEEAGAPLEVERPKSSC
jgi:hypothetical protein